MRRRLSTIGTALSLLLTLAATVAWALSHARPSAWHLLGAVHSADLTRGPRGAGTAVFTAATTGTNDAPFGFWDAGWVRSDRGRLAVLGQAIDHEGAVRRVLASPPSLTVERGDVGGVVVVALRAPAADSWAHRLGFAWQADAKHVAASGGIAGTVDARAWMLEIPYWLLFLVGLPASLRWLRARRRAHDAIRSR